MSTQEWYKPTHENVSPFDSSYREEFKLPPERTEQELRSLRAVISAMHKKPRVLDIAGGFGRIGSELTRQGLVKSLINLDLNREFLQLARKGGVEKVIQGDMRNLPFQEGSFDLALIMFTSFGYFDDKDNFRVLQEAYRVLDNDGVLVLDLPNYSRILHNFTVDRQIVLSDGSFIHYKKRVEGQYLIEERKRTKRNQITENLLPIKLRIYLPKKIIELCQQAGFKKIDLFDQKLEKFLPSASRRLWVVSKKA